MEISTRGSEGHEVCVLVKEEVRFGSIRRPENLRDEKDGSCRKGVNRVSD